MSICVLYYCANCTFLILFGKECTANKNAFGHATHNTQCCREEVQPSLMIKDVIQLIRELSVRRCVHAGTLLGLTPTLQVCSCVPLAGDFIYYTSTLLSLTHLSLIYSFFFYCIIFVPRNRLRNQ